MNDPSDDDSNSESLTAAAPRLPVNRDWLQELLQKHAPAGNSSNKKIHAYALAPMVDQSDLAFRTQCRRYGANLCFTPMVHARLFCTSPTYRRKFALAANTTADTVGDARDRPLIAQLCGSDPHYMLQTAQQLEPHCDAIDINCGCPQGIARRGNYGAFLLEQEELLLKLVRHLVQHLTVPLTVKVRLLLPDDEDGDDDTENFKKNDQMDEKKDDSVDEDQILLQKQRRKQQKRRDRSVRKSIQLYTKLVDAGVHMLTVHGRTRLHKGVGTGPADWEAIRTVVQTLGHRVPIIANGSIATQQEVRDCLRVTGCDGVMSSEAILEYPPLFQGMAERDAEIDENNAADNNNDAATTHPHHPEPPRIGRLQLALEYLDLAARYPPDRHGQGSGMKCIRVHVHRFLHADLQNVAYRDLRQTLVTANSVDELRRACLLLQERHAATGHDVANEELSWYARHRTLTRDAYGVTVNLAAAAADSDPETAQDREAQDQEEAACFTSLFGTAGEDDDEEEDDW